ncbi:hypothetical protein L1987_72827 [Smallanthus sonchifolius]|uniref:Uncharacterized protein n=1 Tax=Smallanthus sonchifolius TaxID=185202 RepID=A0ACB9AWA4_9ASTR|nr:hypothetical protein L1987_72827 [Smallanthus sonchifolius]
MTAISVKKVMSSFGVVSMDLDGGSQLWPVKGTLVSTVMVVVSSVEKGRRWRIEEEEEAVERGLRRPELRRARAMVFGCWRDRNVRFGEGLEKNRKEQNDKSKAPWKRILYSE